MFLDKEPYVDSCEGTLGVGGKTSSAGMTSPKVRVNFAIFCLRAPISERFGGASTVIADGAGLIKGVMSATKCGSGIGAAIGGGEGVLLENDGPNFGDIVIAVVAIERSEIVERPLTVEVMDIASSSPSLW